MRLSQIMCVARHPQDINKVVFKSLLPMRLRNFVSGKSDRNSEVPCLQELSVLFASLKNNDFNETVCKNEINDLKRAHNEHMKKKQLEHEAFTKGIVSTGNDLTYRQLNKYLRRYPNPK